MTSPFGDQISTICAGVIGSSRSVSAVNLARKVSELSEFSINRIDRMSALAFPNSAWRPQRQHELRRDWDPQLVPASMLAVYWDHTRASRPRLRSELTRTCPSVPTLG